MKTCQVCKKAFSPQRMGQSVCSPSCAIKLAKTIEKTRKHTVISEKRNHRAKKEAAKTRQQWLAECQSVANKYARVRDDQDGCISCDKPANWHGQWHGSHFRSVGAASAVRLNLWNIHKACSVCNHHLSGNIAGYRPRLIEKIGLPKVQWLEAQNKIVRYDIDYLKRYKQVIGTRLKRMEKAKKHKNS